jgi:hypothetical protein
LGQKVKTFVNTIQTAGDYDLMMGTSLLNPGIYTASLTLDTGKDVLTRTIKLVKK